MSGPGAKERSRPSTKAISASQPSTVSHKSKSKNDNVDLKSKEEEYRSFIAS